MSRSIAKKDEQGARAGGKSLAAKIFLATFPLMALAVLLAQSAVGLINYRDRLEALESRARLIATLTANAISRPLWNMDSNVYEDQVRAISDDPAFLWATILDEKGTKLFELGEKPAAADNAVLVRLTVPDPAGAGRVGEFELAMSKKELAATAREQILIGLAAFIGLLIAMYGTVHAVTGNLMLSPLKKLLAAMGMVERKEWTTVEWESSDEMGRAVKAFNRMVEGLRSGDEAKRLLKELEAANRLILEGIGYARKIQDGLLPDKEALGDALAEIHVSWEPLQLVGGDYCWLQRFGDRSLIFIADCTGHGVPGAFMTMVVASALERILADYEGESPARILSKLDEMVRARLRQDRPDSLSDDGLDAAICLWDMRTRRLTYSGANQPLLYTKDGRLNTIKPTRASLGYRTLPPSQPFSDVTIDVEPGMSFYLFTDGVPDHMGGEPRRLFGRRRLIQALGEVMDRPVAEQAAHVETRLAEYRGHEPRRDDMMMIAFRPLAGSS
jgi:sigma-B regulation protein RsbU (phosphoserine phosphatase)